MRSYGMGMWMMLERHEAGVALYKGGFGVTFAVFMGWRFRVSCFVALGRYIFRQ